MRSRQWAIIILILFWLGWRLAVPADVVGSDLGRHIKNGELILQGNWDVLYKNYYSYTNPEYPFVNHHWFFGVFCYVLWYCFGFTGLSFIYLLLELFTFYVFFRCWQRYFSFAMACAFGLLSFPLIAPRSQIRPEGITYLFCGLFWWLIDIYQQKRLKPRQLIVILCVLQVIWVNTHIFFIMGPFLTALFWLQARVNKEKEQAAVFLKLFCFLIGMCLINPSGIKGLLEPFNIDQSFFHYPVTEDYSVFKLLKAGFYSPMLLYFMATIGMLCAALFFLVQREGIKKYIFVGSLTLFMSFAGMKALRMIGLYGYFWIPISAYLYSRWMQTETAQVRKNVEIALVVIGIIVSSSVGFDWKQRPDLRFIRSSNDAADFFKRENISGPIFNNLDIGSYLIFHLSPRYQVFIDNRIQPYPEDFLENIYIKMQWDDGLWHQLEQKYRFNVIIIAPDNSPWGFKFFVNRLRDHSWALVFFNDQVVIFLKRNAQNAGLIRRDEIPVNIKINTPAMPKSIDYK